MCTLSKNPRYIDVPATNLSFGRWIMCLVFATAMRMVASAQAPDERPFVPPELAVKGMVAALSDANEAVAAHAARRLGDWRRADVALEMVRLLGPESPALVRDAALIYFSRIGEAARPHLPAVVAQLRDENARIRELALNAVLSAGGGGAHLGVIVPLLKDDRVEVRTLAADCIAQAGPAARAHLPALREGLGRARTKEFRRAVLSAMADVGGLSLEDTESLLPLLQHANDEVRVAAFGAVEAAVAELEAPAVNPRLEAIESAARAQFMRENDEVRAAMIQSAVRSKRLAALMLDDLLKQIADGGSEVQAAALAAISVAGEKALPHVARVTAKLEAPEPDVRAAAIRALRMMGPQAVMPNVKTIAQALKHESAQVRNEALLALPLAGDALRQFPYRIRTAIPDASPAVRNTLLKAAGVLVEKLGVDEEWLAQAREALDSKERGLRIAMCMVASRFGMKKGRELFPQLIALLKDSDADVRGDAAVSLRSFAEDDASRAALREALRPLLKDAESDVRWAALDTLFELEISKDEGLVAEVAGLMDDEDSTIREAAVRTLGSAGPSGRRYLPRIFRFFDEHRGMPSYAVVETLMRLGPMTPQELAQLLQHAAASSGNLPLLRTTAYATTGGDSDKVLLVRLIGHSSGTIATLVKPSDIPKAETQIKEALRAPELNSILRKELEARASELKSSK